MSRCFLSLRAWEGQTTKGCYFSLKRSVRGAGGSATPSAEVRRLALPLPAAFSCSGGPSGQQLAGGGAGAVSDPCLPRDPHPRRGCGRCCRGRAGQAVWCGRCCGLALSTGAPSPAARAARAGLGVGSVAVTKIAILTLRERRRQKAERVGCFEHWCCPSATFHGGRAPPPSSCTAAEAIGMAGETCRVLEPRAHSEL